jgi:hypothetical protein
MCAVHRDSLDAIAREGVHLTVVLQDLDTLERVIANNPKDAEEPPDIGALRKAFEICDE